MARLVGNLGDTVLNLVKARRIQPLKVIYTLILKSLCSVVMYILMWSLMQNSVICAITFKLSIQPGSQQKLIWYPADLGQA